MIIIQILAFWQKKLCILVNNQDTHRGGEIFQPWSKVFLVIKPPKNSLECRIRSLPSFPIFVMAIIGAFPFFNTRFPSIALPLTLAIRFCSPPNSRILFCIRQSYFNHPRNSHYLLLSLVFLLHNRIPNYLSAKMDVEISNSFISILMIIISMALGN